MPKKSKSSIKARSAAARRGWETRRRNERAAAAKRGWETRRKNEQQRKTKAKAAKEIQSIDDWNALNFGETEDIEIVANADY